MAHADDYAASLDPRVQEQVTAAIYSYAQQVDAENTAVPGHTQRVGFANKVVTGEEQIQPLILSACSFASLNAASTDSTVNDAVATLWDIWSGV
jgi:hypothetical protein